MMQAAEQPSRTITATMLRLLHMCERRVWLDQYGDLNLRDEITPILAHRFRTGVQHEEEIHEAAGTPMEPVPITSWAEGVRITRELMEQGLHTLIGVYLERPIQLDGISVPLVLRGRIDRLERVDAQHRFGWLPKPSAPLYAPIKIKRYSRLNEMDFLQLDAYLWLLEGIQPQAVSGWFWMGQGDERHPRYKTEYSLDEARLNRTLQQFAQVLALPNPPPVKLEPHCKTCHWYSSCHTTMRNHLHVSILPGLSKQAKQHLQQKGITTLDQIVEMPPESLKQFKGIKTTAHAVHAQARAFVENRPVWFEALPDVCRCSGIMFDLETDPFTQLPWSWGWVDSQNVPHVLIVADGRRSQEVLLADGRIVTVVPDKDVAWQVFAEALADSECPIYHWTGFDAGILRGTASWDVRERLEHRMHDLHHSFKQSVKFPVTSNSLKVVARYLKFEWAEYEAWDAAYWDYQRWLRHGDVEALIRSCNYQQADVEALTVVWQWLTQVSVPPEATT